MRVTFIFVVAAAVAFVAAEPPHPSINHQTSTGTVTYLDEMMNIQTQAFTTSIDPKAQLYYSTQGIGSTQVQVYMNASMVTSIVADECLYFHTREFGRPMDYYHFAAYLGELEITTPYFPNITAHRFQGDIDHYGMPFDLYTKPGDPDFIIRKVYYRTADYPGAILDTREYTYEYNDADYFAVPARYTCVDGASGKRQKLPLHALHMLWF